VIRENVLIIRHRHHLACFMLTSDTQFGFCEINRWKIISHADTVVCEYCKDDQ